jgi:hypothetical protein
MTTQRALNFLETFLLLEEPRVLEQLNLMPSALELDEIKRHVETVHAERGFDHFMEQHVRHVAAEVRKRIRASDLLKD